MKFILTILLFVCLTASGLLAQSDAVLTMTSSDPCSIGNFSWETTFNEFKAYVQESTYAQNVSAKGGKISCNDAYFSYTVTFEGKQQKIKSVTAIAPATGASQQNLFDKLAKQATSSFSKQTISTPLVAEYSHDCASGMIRLKIQQMPDGTLKVIYTKGK